MVQLRKVEQNRDQNLTRPEHIHRDVSSAAFSQENCRNHSLTPIYSEEGKQSHVCDNLRGIA